MEDIIGIACAGMLGIVLLGAVALVIHGTIFKTRFGINLGACECAECGTPIPSVVRIPKTPWQTIWGGWTCEKCGLELDKWGNPR